MKPQLLISVLIFILSFTATAQKQTSNVITGADRMETYLPLLKGKKVAVFANQTSIVSGVHLVDTLVKREIKVVKILDPNTALEVPQMQESMLWME